MLLGTAFMAFLLAAPASPAGALTVAVNDPVNKPANVDIRRVAYSDREAAAVTTVKVRDLGPSGRLVAKIAPQDADVIYFATVTRTASGKMTRKLEYVTDISRETHRCGFSASWSAANNIIRVSVPQRCLDFGQFMSKHWMQATLRVGSKSDAAPARNLGRGDSPGCVTQTEYRNVARGQTKGAVHAALDTAGRPGAGGAGGYSRVYSRCGSSQPYWIEYNGQNGKVATKGVVRS